jgi:hypothetical protein
MKTILRIAPVEGKPSEYTVATVEAADNATISIVPEFIRLPKPGSREPFTGLSRSKLNQLILPSEENGHKPPVRSVVLRKRGAIRGVRLIFLDSLIAYIREQAIFSLTDDWDSTSTPREVNSLRSNDFGNKSKVN